MFTRLLIHQATVYRQTSGGYDDYGNEITSFEPDESPVACRIQAAGSSETTDERDTVVKNATGFFSADADLDAYVQIEFDEQMWEIVGEPALLYDSTGAHHYEASLRRVIA